MMQPVDAEEAVYNGIKARIRCLGGKKWVN